ncbi:MAG: hypothetical protein H0X42_13655 [Solirubrobacterales bacterium]|nr:hypothetical protein [Solirubrobacterales bacterium]
MSDDPDTSAPAEPEAPTTGVDDADDLRGFHFKRLMRKTSTLVLIGLGAVVAGGVLGGLVGPAIGGGAFVVALLVGVVVVFAIADSKAADTFFEIYAQQRGMTLTGRSRLPAATPLLRKGDDRYSERSLLGPIGDGFEGTLSLYTYEEESTDSKGNRETSYYHYTVGLLEVPECSGHVAELYCQRKFGLRALEKFEDVFRRSKERVKLESEVLDEKYEIFAGKGQDEVWLHQLFSPTFIVWLTDAAPNKFAFELANGTLCCYVSGHKEDAEELDGMMAASVAVAKRLKDEASE